MNSHNQSELEKLMTGGLDAIKVKVRVFEK